MGNAKSAIETYSGIFFDLENVKPEDVHLDDIAHALAMTCRFNGMCERFYSVAQHSVWVSLLPETLEGQRYGLMHDASEAYIADLSRPAKMMDGMRKYREVEATIMEAVRDRFGLFPFPTDFADVKTADNQTLYTEAHQLMKCAKEWGWEEWLVGEALLIPKSMRVFTNPTSLRCWNSTEAKSRFLERANELNLEVRE